MLNSVLYNIELFQTGSIFKRIDHIYAIVSRAVILFSTTLWLLSNGAIKLDGLRTAETMYMVAQKAQTTNKRALSTQPLLSLSALHTLLIVVDWVAMHYGYWSQRWPQRTCISHT